MRTLCDGSGKSSTTVYPFAATDINGFPMAAARRRCLRLSRHRSFSGAMDMKA